MILFKIYDENELVYFQASNIPSSTESELVQRELSRFLGYEVQPVFYKNEKRMVVFDLYCDNILLVSNASAWISKDWINKSKVIAKNMNLKGFYHVKDQIVSNFANCFVRNRTVRYPKELMFGGVDIPIRKCRNDLAIYAEDTILRLEESI